MLGRPLDFLRRIRRAGAQIEVDGESLRVKAAPGMLTDAVKQKLVALKPEIIALFADAFRLLNERGVRLVSRSGGVAFAIWRDADGREVHGALDLIGHGETELLYLDDFDADIPDRYREFVPQYVNRIWAARGLPATGPQRIEAAARARRLNLFFDTYGTSPHRSRITTETALHGMLRRFQAGSE